jgi:flagellar basal-body rod protein FlgF
MPFGKIVVDSMQKDLERMDAIANNLANTSTPGYRRMLRIDDGATFKAALDQQAGVYTETAAPLDVSIKGTGYFRVQGDDNRTLLTRDGQFRVGPDGSLLTASGLQVLGDGGPLRLDPTARVTVDQDGSVRQKGALAGRLQVVVPDTSSQLQPIGSGVYQVTVGGVNPAVGARLESGQLEQSNVNPLFEMTDYLAVGRSFEIGQKALLIEGDVKKRLVEDVGHSR